MESLKGSHNEDFRNLRKILRRQNVDLRGSRNLERPANKKPRGGIVDTSCDTENDAFIVQLFDLKCLDSSSIWDTKELSDVNNLALAIFIFLWLVS
jgi:hypothetical protein